MCKEVEGLLMWQITDFILKTFLEFDSLLWNKLQEIEIHSLECIALFIKCRSLLKNNQTIAFANEWLRGRVSYLSICLQTWILHSHPFPCSCLKIFSLCPKQGPWFDMCRLSTCLNPFYQILKNKMISNLWFLLFNFCLDYLPFDTYYILLLPIPESLN